MWALIEITVGSRASRLARVQVDEVFEEISHFHPELKFKAVFVETYGDRDQKTSLRSLEKTDFFTREVDDLLLNGQCRIAVHSAKDLPDPLPKGMKLIALTAGKEASDSLVMRDRDSLASLPFGALIATSSERREEAVRQLRDDFQFIDLRGTIDQRLLKLETGEADGVVVAEAALIRLQLTHLNRLKLPGETVKYQGQLAIVAKENDHEMSQLFASIDCRP